MANKRVSIAAFPPVIGGRTVPRDSLSLSIYYYCYAVPRHIPKRVNERKREREISSSSYTYIQFAVSVYTATPSWRLNRSRAGGSVYIAGTWGSPAQGRDRRNCFTGDIWALVLLLFRFFSVRAIINGPGRRARVMDILYGRGAGGGGKWGFNRCWMGVCGCMMRSSWRWRERNEADRYVIFFWG